MTCPAGRFTGAADIFVDHGLPGVLVTVSGFDGVGKSTQVDALVRRTADAGRRASATRQPTTRYRHLPAVSAFTESGGSPGSARWLSVVAAADRYLHLQEYVLPRLADGEVVVCDRYVYDFLAVFAQRGVPPELLLELSVGLPRPDLAVHLEADLAAIVRRLGLGSSPRRRHEERNADSIARVLDAYAEVAHLMTSVDATLDADGVTERIWREMPVS